MTYNTFSEAHLCAGKELEWFAADNSDRMLTNLKKSRDLLELNGWVKHPSFSYKFNNKGFRCPEFSNAPSIMYLGCSHTFGLGIPYEKSWPYIVSDELALANVNLSWPGTSNDTAFRLAYHYIPIIKPKVVVLLSPFEGRLELIKNDQTDIRFIPSMQRVDTISEYSDNYEYFYRDWLSSDTNLTMNKIKNTLAIEKICIEQGIPFVLFESNEFKQIDLARDLLHHGIQSNRLFANKVKTRITSVLHQKN